MCMKVDLREFIDNFKSLFDYTSIKESRHMEGKIKQWKVYKVEMVF